jgi:localization factor PodJL
MANLADRVADPGGLRDMTQQAAPAPLRSATGYAAAGPMSHTPAGVDHFDILDASMPGDAANPWDEAAAEALTALHESGATGYAIATPDPESTRSAVASMPTGLAFFPAHGPAMPTNKTLSAASSEQPATAQASGAEIDMAWLAEQISGLARRFEHSLADLSPDNSVQVLGERFNEFEERLAVAFDSLATRTDVEAIGLIEAHIGELTTHLEAAHAQLARLEGIESHLQVMTEQLSDERLQGTAASVGSTPMPAASELQMLVAEAAERAATRVQSMVSQPKDGGGSNELRVLMDRFMDERRIGDEHMASMLDTMQQALIRVLDRMDAMEMAQLRSPQAMPRQDAYAGVSPAASQAGAPAGIAGPNYSHMPIEPQIPAYSAPAMEPQVRHEPNVQMPPAAREAEPAPANGVAGPSASIDKIRKDFKADAQRAKMKAQAEAEAAAQAAVKLESPAKANVRKNAPSPHVVPEPQPKPSMFANKRAVMLAALALMLAAAGGVLMLPKAKKSATAPSAAKSEQSAKPTAKADPQKPRSVAPSDPTVPMMDGPAAPPQAAPSQGKAAPDTQDNSVPETVTDDLSMGEEISDPQARTASNTQPDSGSGYSPLNMNLQSPTSAPLGSDLLKLAGAPVTPVSLSPQAPAAITGAAASASALDLPPVTVGPLSLRLAAAKGDPSAEFEVASRLAEGKGTSQNFQEAMRWYQRSAGRGFAQAQYRLGTLYERGLGAPADLGRARTWYQRAADGGNVKAMHNLAVLSAGGHSGTPDYAAAARWFQLAADRNLPDSQFNIGVLYESGLGVEKDLRAALKWFSLAAQAGDKEAVRRRDQLKPRLSATDVAEANRMIQAFSPLGTDIIANDPRVAGEDWKKRQSVDGNG